MNLRILLPFGIFCTVGHVSSIVAETPGGSFGLLPHRLDCVAALAPGILTYTVGEPVYLAADEGVLIKRGADVTVAVRHCIRGATLALLHGTVQREFLSTSTQDEAVRRAITQLESGLVGRFLELHRER